MSMAGGLGALGQGFEQGDGLRVALLQIETGGQSLCRLAAPGIALQSGSKLGFSLR